MSGGSKLPPLFCNIAMICYKKAMYEPSFAWLKESGMALCIVPTIYADDIKPCLAPPLDIMDFCQATRTEIDIDYVICFADRRISSYSK